MRRLRLSVVTGLLLMACLLAIRMPTASAEEKMINVNTASAAELAGLKGIGEKKAQAIVAYREQNGSFKAVDDLAQVKGIGPKLLEQLRPQVTVGADAKAKAAAVAAPAKH
jgi:competence protein ComEA